MSALFRSTIHYVYVVSKPKSIMLVYHLFFVKQKTAYEMRISDWSSDVCSSDLIVGIGEKDDARPLRHRRQHRIDIGCVVAVGRFDRLRPHPARRDRVDGKAEAGEQHLIAHARKSAGGQMQYLARSGAVDHPRRVQPIFGGKGFAKRSGRCEERRVGTACVSRCRSRWSRYD